ncbi:HEAT repeat domain-containing protein [Pseudoalteromonas sp. T1lg48]|uniref:HEAT repeat domain-containing protein n=1 Tax=Pseudoalteromonas sp. T1lg48 TaxID=2077100 RepID=UPI000CF6BD78|nr:HEAT repeat domain-containing protein [Pseudoalteromonas sp. T1lg48]
MFTMKKITITAALSCSLLLQGCAPSSYNLSKPQPSPNAYESSAQLNKQTIQVVDQRSDKTAPFTSGILPSALMYEGTVLKQVDFLESQLAEEFAARDLPLTLGEGDNKLEILRFNMRNHRTNGFTPFITFTMLKGKLETTKGSYPVAVYVKRGKVPVWSFDEIIEPTLNEPMSLVVKELSAKINQQLMGGKLSDEKTQTLIDSIKAAGVKANYLDVYELGFSNNPIALPYLRELVKSEDEYLRLAAISSLGNMKDDASVQLLIDLYEGTGSWSDRAMALKALGDIGNTVTYSYLQKQNELLQSDGSKEGLWNREIIQLYL